MPRIIIRGEHVTLERAVKETLRKAGYRVIEKTSGWWWFIKMDSRGSAIEDWMGSKPESDAHDVTNSEEWAWIEALEHWATHR